MKRFLLTLSTVIGLFATTNAQLQADFSADVTSGCSPLIVNFSNLSTGTSGATTYEWNFETGSSSVEHPSRVFNNVGIYTVRLIAIDGGTRDTMEKVDFIEVYDNPTVAFTPSANNGCDALNVAFTNLSSSGAPISNILWDFGDGAQSNDLNPIHNYQPTSFVNGEASFDITLVVSDANNCQATEVFGDAIIIGESPNANFNSADNIFCAAPATVEFFNQSTNTSGVSYTWDFGNGNTSSQANPTETYTAEGNYNVTLTAINNNGCSASRTINNYVQIEGIDISLSANTSQACQGEQVQFTATSNLSGLDLFWDFGDGNISEIDANTNHVYASPGTYNVTLQASTPGGLCAESASTVIEVLGLPSPSFASDVQTSCSTPFEVQFASFGSYAGYVWSFGEGGSSTSPNPTYIYNDAGNHDVTLTVINAEGCSNSVTLNDYISITPPTASFTMDDNDGCMPLPIQFSDESTSSAAIIGWTWDFGDGNTSNQPNPSHTYTSVGRYEVSLIILDAEGCQAVISGDSIFVGEQIDVDFIYDVNEACIPDAIITTNLSGPTPLPEDISWIWEFGDGGTSSMREPIYQYGDTGIFDVSLTATFNGCDTTQIKEEYITIYPPLANFTADVICEGNRLDVLFDDISLGADSTVWVFSNGDVLVNQDSFVYNFADTGSYNIKLYAYNFESGCVDSTDQDLELVWMETGFTVDQTVVCRNESIQVTDLSSNSSSLVYFLGDGWSTSNRNPSHSYADTGFYDITQILVDINGCQDTLVQPTLVTVRGAYAQFDQNRDQGCRNTEFNFTDLSTSNADIVTWGWNYGNGITDSSINGSVTYSTTGYFDVSLYIEDENGCSDMVTKNDTVFISSPTPAFTVIDRICLGDSAEFINSSSDNSLSYVWDFGDDNTSTEESPTYIYMQGGLYDVSLTASDTLGCDSTILATEIIQVDTLNIQFTSDETLSSCPPMLVGFDDATEGDIVSWEWVFGDGTVSNLTSPDHVYSEVGAFDVTLTVVNAIGCTDSSTLDSMITVNGPLADIEQSQVLGCTGQDVTLSISNTNSVNQMFDFGDGNLYNTANNSQNHSYNTPGNYLPIVILDNGLGCLVAYELDSVSISAMNAGLTFTRDYLCPNDSLFLHDASTSLHPIESYTWLTGDGNTLTGANQIHLYNEGGYFDLTLIVENAYCSDTATDVAALYVDTSTIAQFELPNQLFCPPVLVDFVNTSSADSAILDYSWTIDGSTASTFAPSVTFEEAGVYTAELTVLTSSGCRDTFTQTVVIDSIPEAHLPDTTLCMGTTWNPTLRADYTYRWESSMWLDCFDCHDVSIYPEWNTTFNVELESTEGCVNSFSFDVEVVSNPSIETTGDERILLGDSIQLGAFSNNAISYDWTSDSSLSCDTCNYTMFAGVQSETVTVSVTDANGCVATEDITIEVFDNCIDGFYTIPNVFTPNGDGINDVFEPLSLISTPVEKFALYDRWGNQVFQTNDPDESWDGRFNGQPLNGGVFVYTLEVMCPDGNAGYHSGNVTLMR